MWIFDGKKVCDVLTAFVQGRSDDAAVDLEACLQQHKTTFVNLFYNPSRNAQACEKLKKASTEGILLCDALKPVLLQRSFVDEALILSELFDLNEVRAAELLLAGDQQLPSFPGFTRGLCAILVYYDNRRYIARALSMLVENRSGRSWSPNLNVETLLVINNFCDQIWKEGLPSRIIELLRTFDFSKEWTKLYEKRALGNQMHQKLVRDFITESYESLAEVLLLYCCQTPLNSSALSLMFAYIRNMGAAKLDSTSHEKYTTSDFPSLQRNEVTLVAAVLYCINTSVLEKIDNEKELTTVLPFAYDKDYLLLVNKEVGNAWACRGLQSVFQFAWSLAIRNMTQHHLAQSLVSELNEDEDDILEKSIDNNVFVYIRCAMLANKSVYSDQFTVRILHNLLIEFIVNFPLKLKELRTRTEEEIAYEEELDRAEQAPVAKIALRFHFEHFLRLLSELYAEDPLQLNCHYDYWLDAAHDQDVTTVVTRSFSQKQASLYRFLRTCGELLSPRLYVVYLKMLKNLSSGASAVNCFNLLKSNANYGSGTLSQLSWDHVFRALYQYYETLRAQRMIGSSMLSHSQISPVELSALLSWLDLIRKIAHEDRICRLSFFENIDWSVSQTLFGLLGCPVPLDLKGAVLCALAEFSLSPELILLCWEGIEAAGLLPLLPDGKFGGIQQELDEVEAKHEVYPVTRGLLTLLCNLWSHDAIVSTGVSSKRYVDFILSSVLARFDQRSYKNKSEMWEIAVLTFLSLYEYLKSANLGQISVHGLKQESASAADYLMTLLLTDSPAFRKVMWIISEGVELIEQGVSPDAFGGHPEKATLYALKLIYTVAARQAEFFNNIRNSGKPYVTTTIDVLLLSTNPKSGAADYIMSIARYVGLNYWFPEHALFGLRLLQFVTKASSSQASLVRPFILNEAETDKLRARFVNCLNGAELCADWELQKLETSGRVANPDEIRGLSALCLLDIMITSLKYPEPNFAHFLLGFNLHDPVATCFENPGISAFPRTCLHAVIDLLDTALDISPLHQTFPALLVTCYKLLYSLASLPSTSQPVLRYLRTSHNFLYRHLQKCPFYVEPFKDLDISVHLLEQQSVLLKLCAVEIRHLVAGNQCSQFMCMANLLLQNVESEPGADSLAGDPLFLDSKTTVFASHASRSITLQTQAPVHVRRLLLVMLDSLPLGQTFLEEAALEYFDPAKLSEAISLCSFSNADGIAQVDINALQNLLYKEAVALKGTPLAGQQLFVHKEVENVLHRAVKFNALQIERKIRIDVVDAWCCLCESVVNSLAVGSFPVTQHSQVMVEIVLEILLKLGGDNILPQSVTPLASCVLMCIVNMRRVILSDIASSLETTATLLDGTCIPQQQNRAREKQAKLFEISGFGLVFKLILESILKQEFNQSRTKTFFYGSLLNFFYLTTTARPDINSAILADDECISQEHLMNMLTTDSCREYLTEDQLTTLYKYSEELLVQLSKDASSVSDVTKALALCCLNAIVSLDSVRRGQLCSALASNDQLRCLVDSVVADSDKLSSVFSNINTSLRPLYIFQTRMMFFMTFASSPRGLSLLLQYGLLQRLAECRALTDAPDVVFDDFFSWNVHNNIGSRYRVAFCAALNVCLAIANGSLHVNVEASRSVLQFCVVHMTTLNAILQAETKALGPSQLSVIKLVTSVIAHTALQLPREQGVYQLELNSCADQMLKRALHLLPTFSQSPSEVLQSEAKRPMLSMSGLKQFNDSLASFRSSVPHSLLSASVNASAELDCLLILNNLLSHVSRVTLKPGSSSKFCQSLFAPFLSNASNRQYSLTLAIVLQTLKMVLSHFSILIDRLRQSQRVLQTLPDCSLDEQCSLLSDMDSVEKLNIGDRHSILTQRLCTSISNCQHQIEQIHYIAEICLTLLWQHLEYYLVHCSPSDAKQATPSAYHMLLESTKSRSMRKLQDSSFDEPSEAQGIEISRDILDRLKMDASVTFDDVLLQRVKKIDQYMEKFKKPKEDYCFSELLIRRLQRLVRVKTK